MAIIARIGFALVKQRHGLRGDGISTSDDARKEASQFGVRGETYWHPRRLKYIFVRTART